MTYEPERPISPPEPVTDCNCLCCGGEIYKGEIYYKATLGRVCRECMDALPFNEFIAGRYDDE